MSAPWWWPFNALFWRIPEVSSKKLSAAIEAKTTQALSPHAPLLLLDVRAPYEFTSFHIPGALNVPIGSLRENLDSIREIIATAREEAGDEYAHSKPSDVVCICLSAHRSPPAVRLLKEHGIDACQLGFGMAAWKLGGYPTVSGASITVGEHLAQLRATHTHAHEGHSSPAQHADHSSTADNAAHTSATTSGPAADAVPCAKPQ